MAKNAITPPIQFSKSRTLSQAASPTSCASPAGSYGSFPPSILSEAINNLKRNRRSRGLRYTKQWSTSSEAIIGQGEDIYEDSSHGNQNLAQIEDEVWTAGEDGRSDSLPRIQSRLIRERSAGYVTELLDLIPQRGVLKMELMSRHWDKTGLYTVFGGVYLISTLISLEGNTLPTVEPYFLSLLGSHSMLSSIAIVTNLAYAVGKLPFSKVLDVFGRAEGVALAAGLYSFGFLLTSSATDVRVYVIARAIAALGGQGLQLAQQIIIADTTTLSNRGLITSTISLPWLATTWIGPPLALVFLNRGEAGYRLAYGTFGILLPLVSLVLVCTLLFEWRKIRGRYQKIESLAVLDPSTLESIAFDNHTPWVDKARANVEEGKEEFISTTTWATSCSTVWRELDVVGLVTFTLGGALLLLPLTLAAQKPETWFSPNIWLLLLCGVAVLTFFGYYEWNISLVPMLPPRLLCNKTILAGSIMGFTHFCSQFIYESFFTSFLQVARGHSPRDASYISQSYIFAASVSAIIAGIGCKMSRRYKWIGILGVVIHFLGTCLMLRVRNLNSSTSEMVLSQVLGGIGGGFSTIAAQIGVQSVVGRQDTATATAIFLTITQTGGAVGGALAGSVWSALLPSRLRVYLPTESHGLIENIISSLPYALSFESGSVIRTAINQAYVDTQLRLNILALIMLLPCIAAMMFMKDTHLVNDDLSAKERVVVLGSASFVVDQDTSSCSETSETSSLLGPHSR